MSDNSPTDLSAGTAEVGPLSGATFRGTSTAIALLPTYAQRSMAYTDVTPKAAERLGWRAEDVAMAEPGPGAGLVDDEAAINSPIAHV